MSTPRPLPLLALALTLALLLAGPAHASGGGGGKDSGNLVALEPFLMNLADPGGKALLRLAVAVQLKDPKKKAEITDRLPLLREAVILAISTKSTKHLETSSGKTKLKTEVQQIIARRCGLPESDVTVFFTEFVIQFVN